MTNPPAQQLVDCIRIDGVYTRSINLARDGEAVDLVAAYRPTSRALADVGPEIPGELLFNSTNRE